MRPLRIRRDCGAEDELSLGFSRPPALECILLSHCHAGDFDQVVEMSLNRRFDMISNTYAKECLALSQSKDGNPLQSVHDPGFFESLMLHTDGQDYSHTNRYRGLSTLMRKDGVTGPLILDRGEQKQTRLKACGA
ncbi:hypothetical protein F4779DRAFT_569414 [Xylariaceae sp. FL0662B]|nr:hypothetical protein F4779DRAFT_569414 [Xylariaceae sp. FL0662B]